MRHKSVKRTARATSPDSPRSTTTGSKDHQATGTPPEMNVSAVPVSAPVQFQHDDVRGLFTKKETQEDQFRSDVDLWHKTLTQKGDLQGGELAVHEQQQDLMKRHFMAMAVLGPQAGNQKTGEYQNIDNFTASGAQEPTRAPLASLASHGGRFAYESQHKDVGDNFKNHLLFGTDDPQRTQAARRHHGVNGLAVGSGSRASDRREASHFWQTGRDNSVHAGLYSRNSSHPQSYNTKTARWEEGKSMLGTNKVFSPGQESVGMNIAFGGVGNTAESHGTRTTIGPEGDIMDPRGRKAGQHGHAFFKYDTHPDKVKRYKDSGTSRMMVGFEGSAPSTNSMLGAHDLKSMVKKGGNSRSITGQDKAEGVGLPSGKGAVRANIDHEQLREVKEVFGAMKHLKAHPETESHIIRALLEAKTEKERNSAIARIKILGDLARRKAEQGKEGA